MLHTTLIKGFAAWRQHPARWSLIVLFAIFITYMDGFWMTAIQGVVGAIERNEPPFSRWLRDSTIMLPLIILAVFVGFAYARHWFRNSQRKLIRFWGSALVITMISAGAGIAEAINSSLIDYRYQVHHVELLHSYGNAPQTESAKLAGFGSTPYYLYCDLRGTLIGSAAKPQVAGNAITWLEYLTFVSHVRALVIDAALILITNLSIVALLLALLGERVWAPQLATGPIGPPIAGTATQHYA